MKNTASPVTARRSPNSGFTLIELLVVISIIAILASLSFAGVNGALKASKRAQASAMLNSLRIAVVAYNTEYGVWPLPSSNTTDTYPGMDPSAWKELCVALNGNKNPATGLADVSTIANTRGFQFMEFNKKDLKGTTSADGYVADPTISKSRTDRTYVMFLDGNYDNAINVSYSGAGVSDSGTVVVNAGVAVYSRNEATSKNKALTSW